MASSVDRVRTFFAWLLQLVSSTVTGPSNSAQLMPKAGKTKRFDSHSIGARNSRRGKTI